MRNHPRKRKAHRCWRRFSRASIRWSAKLGIRVIIPNLLENLIWNQRRTLLSGEDPPPLIRQRRRVVWCAPDAKSDGYGRCHLRDEHRVKCALKFRGLRRLTTWDNPDPGFQPGLDRDNDITRGALSTCAPKKQFPISISISISFSFVR
jgi:hypothetical protein